MKLSERLYEKAQPIWEQSHSHPFVQGIGNGTLDIEKFKFFMCQDYLYLIDYARLFALGSLKAHNLETMQTFAKMLHVTLDEEMSLHRAYAKRLGISKEELEATKPAPTTLAYSSYMLNIAQRGSLKELLAAVMPCAWSYYEIGKKLSETPGAMEHVWYGEWVTMYQSPEFGEVAEWQIDLLDQLTESSSEEELLELEEIFLTTSRFEYMFWDMSYQQAMWPLHD
ncbi:thiaminase [Alkalihalobacillus alcalophilus ATCC 27647 = CGMCC 1.3604]|uniref:Aminopyrimidine aminohydrolase n=1 Tax=Alkalihalobacillus alcalophilus ATCC 27647 = CGMCC 1.3604 TaxID=1218173 RepID=A0A094YY71_ALKAL|nr:thiaminase II [Alkalihalobacillus alcalophilus]KGA98487.1 TENA/THI-4 family protein [Alkalihalobacillus alcalophilus ATCC 27647 = CGMCC 1.3604]MED1562919.1 thiaminase II [Alkalihalobacillus alcalophilus]THG91733.1 thiaminase [Alkalihalobacillus alcalophilus ATCC 27647 = CGMCC 1.3604]